MSCLLPGEQDPEIEGTLREAEREGGTPKIVWHTVPRTNHIAAQLLRHFFSLSPQRALLTFHLPSHLSSDVGRACIAHQDIPRRTCPHGKPWWWPISGPLTRLALLSASEIGCFWPVSVRMPTAILSLNDGLDLIEVRCPARGSGGHGVTTISLWRLAHLLGSPWPPTPPEKWRPLLRHHLVLYCTSSRYLILPLSHHVLFF